MDALRTAFDGIYRDLALTAPTLSAEVLSTPNPYEPGRARFATTGEFIKWIKTGHLGYHLGQLSAWRGMAGLSHRPK